MKYRLNIKIEADCGTPFQLGRIEETLSAMLTASKTSFESRHKDNDLQFSIVHFPLI